MTTVEQDREPAQAGGLLDALRAAEMELWWSYSRMLAVVAELDAEKVAAVTGFGTTPRLLAGVLNLSKGEAKTRADQAELLTLRRSLIGEPLPPVLPATAAQLAAGRIGHAHLRVITAVMRRLPDATHPETAAPAEQTLAPPPPADSTPPRWPVSVSAYSPILIPTAKPRTRSPNSSGSCGSVPVLTAPSASPARWTPRAASGYGSPQFPQRPPPPDRWDG